MNSLRGMPIAAAVNPNAIFPDNANTTTTVVPLAMNLHRRALTMVRFCESIPIPRRAYRPMNNSTGHNAFTKLIERGSPMLTRRSGIDIPINLNGRPTKRMTFSVRSDCSGDFFRLNAPPSGLHQEALSGHLNERGEVPRPFHLHRRPLGPNPKSSNLARADSTVSSW